MPNIYPEINSDNSINTNYTGEVNKKCNSQELINTSNPHNNSKQSPINISTDHVQECHTLCNIDINYKPSICNIEKTSHNILRLKWDVGSYIKYNNNYYELKYVYFHTPSMHTIDNNSSEMEINFYHGLSEEYLPDETGNNRNVISENIEGSPSVSSDNTDNKLYIKKIEEIKNKHNREQHPHLPNLEKTNVNDKSRKGVILSILVNHNSDTSKNNETMATKPNQFFSQFIHNKKLKDLQPGNKSKIETHKNWNVKNLLPKKKHFYTYDGSIPFPPCYEEFQWVIFGDHIEVAEEYIQELRLNGNSHGNREIHPLNHRVVFYNNNIEVEEEKPIETKNKNDIANEILAPIRIRVEDRMGIEYRRKAQEIVSDYTMGEYKDYYDNEDSLKTINKRWDNLGKVGYELIQVSAINTKLDSLDSENQKKYLNEMVFDYDIDFMQDYLGEFLNINITLKSNIDENKAGIMNVINEINRNSSFFWNGDNSGLYEYTFDRLTSNFTDILAQNVDKSHYKLDSVSDENLRKFNEFFNHESLNNINKKIGLYFLIDWDNNYVTERNEKIRLFDKIYAYEESEELHYEIKKKIIELLNNDLGNLSFKFQSNDLNTTVNGFKCQQWGSNQVHYEGSWYDFFSPNLVIPDEGYTMEEIKSHPQKSRLIKMCRDGLLSNVNNKWIPNNNCRNPNNSATAAWCYTTDPTTRWDYCMKPDISFHSKKYILLLVFLIIVGLSLYTVRLLFRFEIFSKFIARLTGAKIDSIGGDTGTPK